MRILWFYLTVVLLFSGSVQAAGREGDSVLGELRERLEGGIHVSVRDEVTGKSDAFDSAPAGEDWKEHSLGRISLAAAETWRSDERGLKWELRFEGAKKRTGHEVRIAFPLLRGGQEVFTPGSHGVVSLAAHPSFKPVAYGHAGRLRAGDCSD